jgi:predicted esterase
VAFLLALLTQTPQFKGLVQSILPSDPAPLTESVVDYPAQTRPAIFAYEPPAQGFQRYQFIFEGKARFFWMLAAQSGPAGQDLNSSPPAAVLLLHGSLRDGRSMLDMWQKIAANGAVLIAPDSFDPANWSLKNDGAAFQTAALAAAMAISPFDPDRVFLYGHSSGAILALELGNCTDLRVQKIAIHAGFFKGCAGWGKPIPHTYLIQTGDLDETVLLQDVRSSAQLIAKKGSPVDLTVIAGHNHWYYHIGPALAAQAWQFFQK